MTEIEKCKSYLRSRQEWFKDKFKHILDKELNHNHVFEHRIQQAYRDCNIVLRRIEVLERKYPQGLPIDYMNEVIGIYKNFRFEEIPQLYNFIELNEK